LKLFVITFWKEELFSDRRNNIVGNKLRTYRLFKYNFSFESYLLYLSEKKRKLLTKFRISVHKLEIEQGRYHKLPIANRMCGLCKTEAGDAIHFLLQCATLNKTRSNFIKDISDKFLN
jgi:nanoRNase/pAp phosphatase (c-di-AMP/oligoRNAs hydrolase)